VKLLQKKSKFYKRYIFCTRRNIYKARKSHIKEDIYLLQKINLWLQINKFFCSRRNFSVFCLLLQKICFLGSSVYFCSWTNYYPNHRQICSIMELILLTKLSIPHSGVGLQIPITQFFFSTRNC
jgi:hypothetical protein